MKTLTTDQIQQALTTLPGWSGDTTLIEATYTFADFPKAMSFMAACIDDIEGQGHHPEWSNVYNRVSIRLRTHDAGDVVTEKDTILAALLHGHATRHGGAHS